MYHLLQSPKWIDSADDPIFAELKEIVSWFDAWRARLIADEAARGAGTGRHPSTANAWKNNFISDKTYADLHLAVHGTVGLMQTFFGKYGTVSARVGCRNPLEEDEAAPVTVDAPPTVGAIGTEVPAQVGQTTNGPATPEASRSRPPKGRAPTPSILTPSSSARKKQRRAGTGAGKHVRLAPSLQVQRLSADVVEGSFAVARRNGGSLSGDQYSSKTAGQIAAEKHRRVAVVAPNYKKATTLKKDGAPKRQRDPKGRVLV